ncbi:MAG: PqqD family protein [Aerococcus sp.]|nr:PqqD family protein [Aerococcus sp.]
MKHPTQVEDLIYAKRSDVSYRVEEGIVTICRQQNHPIQQFFRKYWKWSIPQQSTLTLDEYGSLVFQLIDGKRTVGMIAEALKASYPEIDIHLMTRLVLYLNQMEKDEHLVVCLNNDQ